ncbi:SMP-30/gluconolactonase/LRE family protein [Lutimonas sp.]|uniref:SMP-30/gluconolactonase/LRE family protein n=1 Tax=Lutimonas sp. TaxID=1872403 RepID=UPI003D9B2E5A
MKKIIPSLFIILLLTFSCNEKVKNELPSVNYLESGSIEVLDDELRSLLNPENGLEILAEGHHWTEGPLWIEEQKMLLYNDIPRNSVFSWNDSLGVQLYLSPSGFSGENFAGSEPGANGLLLDPEGNLILCQHGNRQLAKMDSPLTDPKATFVPLVQLFDGKRLNSPNDAVYDSKGNLYFTDHPYGLPKQMQDSSKALEFQGVYMLEKEGELHILDAALSRPNGIAFSPDEKVLYVANSDPDHAIWMAYDMDDDGGILSKHLFFDVTELTSKEKGLPDGLKINKDGYIFATGPGGVFVFNPTGKHIGQIRTGQATSNVAFDAEEQTLFITADSYVLRLKLQ